MGGYTSHPGFQPDTAEGNVRESLNIQHRLHNKTTNHQDVWFCPSQAIRDMANMLESVCMDVIIKYAGRKLKNNQANTF